MLCRYPPPQEEAVSWSDYTQGGGGAAAGAAEEELEGRREYEERLFRAADRRLGHAKEPQEAREHEDAADAREVVRRRRAAKRQTEIETRVREVATATTESVDATTSAVAALRAAGGMPSLEIVDHVSGMSPRKLRAAWKQFSTALPPATHELLFDDFQKLVAQFVAAQGRPPLTTLELLGLFADCDVDGSDGSEAIDFNEWCGAIPRLAALLEQQKAKRGASAISETRARPTHAHRNATDTLARV